MHRRAWVGLSWLVLVAGAAAVVRGQAEPDQPVAAQKRGDAPGKVPPGGGGLEIAEAEGNLAAVVGDRIKIVGENDQETILVMDRETSLRYRAAADPTFVRPGLLVRFTAMFNPQTGVPSSQVTALEIFRPIRARRMTRQLLESQTPGIYPVAAQGGAGQEAGAREEPPGRNPTARGRRTAALQPGAAQPFRIVGQIRGVRGNRLQVVAGPRAVVVEVAPDAKITVAAGDLTFAAPGDKVVATGLAVSGQSQVIQAQEIVVTAAQTLGAGAPKDVGRRAGRRRGATDPAPNDKPDDPDAPQNGT